MHAPSPVGVRVHRGLLAAVSALLVLLVLAVTPGVARGETSGDGSDCLPPGGEDRAFPTESVDSDGEPFDPEQWDVVLNGGGFGHGVGMSQYGAQGAALLGCTYPTILQTYYPETTVETGHVDRGAVAVHLRRVSGAPATATVRTTAAAAGGKALPWVACDLSGTDCEHAVDQPAGTDWTVTAHADGTFTLRDADAADDAPPAWHGGDLETRLRLRHDGTVVRLLETDHGARCRARQGICLKWGFLEFDYTDAHGGTTYATAHVTGSDGVPAMGRYLYGLGEVPSSWEVPALRAQTVAARSYAEATIRGREAAWGRDAEAGYLQHPQGRCRCDLFASTADQAFIGWEKERVDTERRWRDAVDATRGEVVAHAPDEDSPSAPIPAFYSSSHGGRSESVQHVWGSAPRPYLPSVDTSRWEARVDCDQLPEEQQSGCNPYQRWTEGFTDEDLADRFGLAEFDELVVEERGPGGRPLIERHDHEPDNPDNAPHLHLHAVARGRDGAGEAVERRYSGERLRSLLGLRSNLFGVGEWTPAGMESSPAPEPAPEPPPVEVDRLGGSGRVETAVLAAQLGWDTAETVVVARSDHPADALAGSTLAGSLGAPLLITPREGLADAAAEEVHRLGATRAVLLGGPAALAEQVADDLAAVGVTDVSRAAGADRFATAVDIAGRVDPEPDGTAVLVRGHVAGSPDREWPDALAVAGFAATTGRDGAPAPVLLTGEELPEATRAALRDLEVARVLIVGGEAVVPAGTEDELAQAGYEVERLAGADRWATSRAVVAHASATDEVLVTATGENFPDGLAAGPLAARLGGQLLLVPGEHEPEVSPWGEQQHPALVRGLAWYAPRLVVAGGTEAVTDGVRDRLRSLLEAGQQEATAPDDGGGGAS